jgi:DNA-binding GntR family transcriptional regulator
MERKSKTKAAYDSLRNEILSGYLMPETRLIEAELAARYGTSRTIIREVIKKLSFEGLVNEVPYKGASVARLSLREIEETYRIHQDLEGLAVYLATPNLSADHLDELERVNESMEQISEDVVQWQRCNRQFHRVFLENCRNRRLVRLIEMHRDQFARYWFLALSIPGVREASFAQHKEIISAVRDRNPVRVRYLMEKHIDDGAKRVMDVIKRAYPSSVSEPLPEVNAEEVSRPIPIEGPPE